MKQKKNRILNILLVSLMFVIFATQTALAFTVPKPTSDFYVADYAKVLSSDTKEHIISQNMALENSCGAQIVVVTVDFLDGANIEDYAYKLFNSWKIGDEKENNGVLLLLAIGEENYWCMQGAGLESRLTAGDIDDILWNYLEEDFAVGDYDSGVYSSFNELCAEINSIYSGGHKSDYGNDSPFDEIIPLIFAIIVIIVIIALNSWLRSQIRRRGGYTQPYFPSAPRRRSSGHSSFGLGNGHSSRPRRSSGISRSSSSRRIGGGGRSRGGGAGRR